MKIKTIYITVFMLVSLVATAQILQNQIKPKNETITIDIPQETKNYLRNKNVTFSVDQNIETTDTGEYKLKFYTDNTTNITTEKRTLIRNYEKQKKYCKEMPTVAEIDVGLYVQSECKEWATYTVEELIELKMKQDMAQIMTAKAEKLAKTAGETIPIGKKTFN